MRPDVASFTSHWTSHSPPGADHTITLGSANQGYGMSTVQSLEWNGELLLPLSNESIPEASERLMRAIAREAGITYWEPEQR
jgi:hypothetical protein